MKYYVSLKKTKYLYNEHLDIFNSIITFLIDNYDIIRRYMKIENMFSTLISKEYSNI